MQPIRVMLADDHTLVRDGLRAVLRAHPEIAIVAEAGNGEEVLQKLKTTAVDVVVLDLKMPVMDGLTCARKMRVQFPDVKIIVLTMYVVESFVSQIMKIGVHGCVLKSNTAQELKDAITRVTSGKSYFDLMQSLQQDSPLPPANLSRRELEIVKLIADGLTSIQMADQLFIAEETVKTHRKNIMKKVGVNSVSQLIHFARNNELL